MALPKSREGLSLGFHTQLRNSEEWTLGDPEKIIWSSIRQLRVNDVADDVLYQAYKITNKRLRSVIAYNLKLYLQQASEFYEVAKIAKANTAPLFYYYSFLNLAKSLCEIRHPNFHKEPECYLHGIGWKPNREYLVDMEREVVSLNRRGVWHVFWEVVQQQPCKVPNPLPLKVKELFAMNLETTVEYERTFGGSIKYIEMIEPDVLVDLDRNEIWLKFSVERESLKELGLSRTRLLDMISINNSPYRQVESKEKNLWTFELENPKSFSEKPKDSLIELLQPELKVINVFTHPGINGLIYFIPIQTRIPLRLPQIIVLYTLIFWLSSLVRYDPHSLAELQDSEYWILIDGFMNQSPLWLLELFEWELFRTETTLKNVR